MLDCIHAGAADFILKPFRLDVIKTLFLKLHQSNTDYRKHVHDSLNQRIKNMTLKDTQLSNMLMKIYGPQSSIAKSILEVNNESELQSSLYHWDFSPFGQSQQDLIQCAYNIFDLLLKLPELYHLSMTKDQLYGFLTDLANVYHDENPYHNFAHAVDVLQCLFFMLCEMGVLPFTSKRKKGLLLRPSDAFSLLIAAIGHDAAHPGVNNLFLINSATPLAVLYNDRSVLESLHSMTLFQILRNHHILDHLEPTIYKEFRKIVVSSILATDMSLHAEYVSKIRDQAIRLNRTDINTLDSASLENERVLMCSALIKCADISNVARPFRSGARWAELLVEEFVSQGDLERELGMPVLPMNDREKVVLEDSQIGFIRFVALDLFQSVNDMCDISFAVDQMQANLKKWETRKQTTMQHDSGVSNLDDEYTTTGIKEK
ncbi:HD-domain/PDEase-like protein [Backusella circina FSU 941]|nr:HD-domain/PDEase-like protein [Backusella circina FSU 941]